MSKQADDILIYEGKKYDLNAERINLLSDYFILYPHRKSNYPSSNTALVRGYQATFEIKDQQLYVKKLEVPSRVNFVGRYEKVDEEFPNSKKMYWYSGLIRIDEYNYESEKKNQDAIFEYLEVYKGDFIQKRTMDYNELEIFKEHQFDYFKTTEEYRKFYDFFKYIIKNITDDRIDHLIKIDLLRISKCIFDNKQLKER